MKRLMILGALLVLYCNGGKLLAEEITMEPAPITKVYFPDGYDDNDQVEVVLFGYLPNGCYEPGTLKVKVDHGAAGEEGRIAIEAMMAHHHRAACTEILVDYKETVQVGFLQAKKYKVVLTAHPNFEVPEKLTVVSSQVADRDDHVYLPVDQIHLAKTASGQELILSGTLPYQRGHCIEPDRHEVLVGPESVLVVLPIAKVVACEVQEKQSFEYRVPLAGDLMVKKNMMVHVRSLNGRSVSKVYDWVYYDEY